MRHKKASSAFLRSSALFRRLETFPKTLRITIRSIFEHMIECNRMMRMIMEVLALTHSMIISRNRLTHEARTRRCLLSLLFIDYNDRCSGWCYAILQGVKALNYLNKIQERWPGNSTALATVGDSSPPGTFANICADKSEG
jgi:hypothetical protein